MRVRVLAALVLGLITHGLAAGSAGAQPEAHASPQLQNCLDHVIDNEHGSRWPAVVVCYENELSAQDRRLQDADRALDAAAQALGPRALDEAVSSRRQWEAYRDSWCALAQERFLAPNADIARLSCRIEATKAELDRVTVRTGVLR